jgi:lipoprotein-anchoring transpeptidase ErfK/SrfK
MPRTIHRSRALTASAIAAISAVCALAPSAEARGTVAVRPTQALAVLLMTHNAVASPRADAPRLRTVPVYRPITGARTVLPIVGRATARDGAHWLRVLIPGRPNGSRGWIVERGTVLSTTSWHIVVRTSRRQVLVYRRGHLARSFAAVVGKPSTPTPHGHFFVEESVRMLRGVPGGPFALALSARSNVLQEFEGGPGQIALQGVANLGGTPGTAASHGCVRLANRNIRWLAARISAGTPVAIRS